MRAAALIALLPALAACPADDGGNARTLFLAPDMVETEVKLIEQEPPPF